MVAIRARAIIILGSRFSSVRSKLANAFLRSLGSIFREALTSCGSGRFSPRRVSRVSPLRKLMSGGWETAKVESWKKTRPAPRAKWNGSSATAEFFRELEKASRKWARSRMTTQLHIRTLLLRAAITLYSMEKAGLKNGGGQGSEIGLRNEFRELDNTIS